jgi:hypothetical protein
MHRQGANMALDKHAVYGAHKGFAAIGAAPQPFADRAYIKSVGSHHSCVLVVWAASNASVTLFHFFIVNLLAFYRHIVKIIARFDLGQPRDR